MTTDLRALDAPDLQPLRESFDYDQLEADLKDSFLAVFNTYLRSRERQINLHGMPHLGDTELIERTLKDYGLAIVRRDATRTAFLLKAARARNPRRGMIFLRQYLQSVWPGVWKVEPLWHPINTAANYPADRRPLTLVDISPSVQAVYGAEMSEDGLPTIYRTDWQGRQRLYSTPRTNSIRQSANMTLAPWITTSGTSYAGTVTQSTAIPSPDGTATPVNKLVVVNTSNLVARSTHTVPVGQRTGSLWVYVPSGQPGVTGVRFTNDWSDQDVGATASTSVLDAWVRLTSATTITASRSSQDFNIQSLTANLPVGTVLYMAFAQDENGRGGSYIPVTTADVTVTDYTINPSTGVATFADGVTPATPLTYFLTGRIRVTLPVSQDNGLGLLEIAKAFRSTLAARLMLELQLAIVFEGIGSSGGLALSNGAKGVMPFMAIGTLTK